MTRNVFDAQAQRNAARREEGHLVILLHHTRRNDASILFQARLRKRDDTAGVAALGGVFIERGTFAKPLRRHDQEVGAGFNHIERRYPVILAEPNTPHAAGCASHGAHFVFVEAQRLALFRHQDQLLLAAGHPGPSQFVAFFQRHGNDAVRSHRVELAQFDALDAAAHGGHRHIGGVLEVWHGYHRRDAFIRRQANEVDDGQTLTGAAGIRQIEGAFRVNAAFVGKEEDEIKRACAQRLHHLVFVAGVHANDAAPAAPLRPVDAGQGAFDKIVLRQCDQHLLLENDIFVVRAAAVWQNLRSAAIAKFLFQLQDVGLDHLQDFFGMRQQVAQVEDTRHQLLIFSLDLGALEGGQSPQLHVENSLRLHFAQIEARHQPCAGLIHAFRRADERNHLVQELQGDAQTFEDVGAFFGLAQLEARTAGQDFLPVLDINLKRPPQ